MKEGSTTKNNIDLFGKDPWVTSFEGSYLLILSIENDTKIVISRFADVKLTQKIEEKIVWHPEDCCDHSKLLWAPELHTFSNFSDKWYIYYTACNGVNENHRMYVLESNTKDPLGEYHEVGKIADPKNDHWAIDLTVLEHENNLYAIWSGWERDDIGFPQNLYIAKMANPWNLESERVCISKPEFEWERNVAAINEGPQILKYRDHTYLTYSADASWTSHYKLGILTLLGKDVMDPKAWIKHPLPVFETGSTSVPGPGHASFINEEEKNSGYIIYHAKVHEHPGWDRRIHVQQFDYDENGFPNFGCPKPKFS
jgi:GH43 family beta-xylosidase